MSEQNNNSNNSQASNNNVPIPHRLLPKTDMVFVLRFDIGDTFLPPDSSVTSAFVPCDKACEILQGVMIWTDDWPMRYRVSGSFTDEQWDALFEASAPIPHRP